MGIYHCSVKPISRRKGRSVTAAAAYRAAEIIYDERTGLVHDYTRKQGVLATEIMKPSGQSVPDWFFDRERLWNEAELREVSKVARVARDCEIALPSELDEEANHQLTREFSQFLADRYQIAVDYALHAPDSQSDQRNYHAHILMSTRVITEHGFTDKTRVLDDKRTGPIEIKEIRKDYCDFVNRTYARAGLDIIVDHRSLKAQGIDREPTKHLGPDAHDIEMKGRNSELGDHNRAIQNGAKSGLEFKTLSPAERKHIVTELYQQSDNGKALEAALFEHGFILARGDKRDFVIVEQSGDEHSLPRSVNGVRVKQVREKCADLDRLQLPSVAEAHDLWREHDREIEAVTKLQEARETEEGRTEYDREQEETRVQSKFTEAPRQQKPDQEPDIRPEPDEPPQQPEELTPDQEIPEKDAALVSEWSREGEEAERLKRELAAELERIEKAKADLKTEFEDRRLKLQQEHNLRRDQKQHAWLAKKAAAMRTFDEELDDWRNTEQDKYVTCTGEVLENHEKVKELWDRTLCRLNVQNFKRRERKEKNRETYINTSAMRRRSDHDKKLENKYADEMKILMEQERVELRVLANEHKIEERNLDAALEQQRQEQATKQTEQPEQKPPTPEVETPTLDKLLADQKERRSRLESEWREGQADHKKTRDQHWRDWKKDRLAEFAALQDVAGDKDKSLLDYYESIQLRVNPKRELNPAQARQMVEKQLTRIASKELKKEQKQHGRDYYADRDKLRKLELKERLNLADRGGKDAQAAKEAAMKKQREIEREEALRLRRMRERERDERDRDDR